LAANDTILQPLGLENKFILSIVKNSQGEIFVGTSGEGIFVSYDNDQNWKPINTGIFPNEYGDRNCMILLTKDNNVFAVVGWQVLKWHPIVESWDHIYDHYNWQIYDMAMDRDELLYISGYAAFYVSNEEYNDWRRKTSPSLYGYRIESIAINSKNHIFVEIYDNEGAGLFYSRAYRSIDKGDTWTEINPPVGAMDSAVKFYIGKFDHIYAWGDWGKLACSTDNGDTWKVIASGDELNNYLIASNGIIYVGNGDRIILKSENEPYQIPVQFTLQQNYPNPFNSQTVIHFHLPARSACTLIIFDQLGKKVRTLINDVETEGSHDVRWDGTDDRSQFVPSGVYFAILKTDRTSLKIKMLMLK
jgi:hypothetical protein